MPGCYLIFGLVRTFCGVLPFIRRQRMVAWLGRVAWCNIGVLVLAGIGTAHFGQEVLAFVGGGGKT